MEAISGVYIIFNQASAIGVGQSMYKIEKCIDINTMATAKLLDILVNLEYAIKKINRYIFCEKPCRGYLSVKRARGSISNITAKEAIKKIENGNAFSGI